MNLSLGQIIIESKNKELLATFLSDVFEMEILASQDTVTLSKSGTTFSLVDIGSEVTESSVTVNLYTQDKEELHEILKRVQFLGHRLGMKNFNKDTEIFTTDGLNSILLKDTDGRSWKVSQLQ